MITRIFSTNSTFFYQNTKVANNRDSVSSEPQQNHWLLSNLLPQGKSESTSNSTDGSPVRNMSSPNPPMNPIMDGQKFTPQQKPVNLLPEVPTQISLKLSDREQRDCDVIGNKLMNY